MSNNLYLEAIEAAEQLKNSAEEKVKQHIIESMSPQIKMLVEKKLMEEEDDDLLNDESSDESKEDSDSEDKDDKQEERGTAYESVNEVTLDEDSRRILNKFISEKAKKEALSEKIESLKEAIKTIKKATILAENTNVTKNNKSKINLLFKNIVREIKNIKSNSIIKSDKTLLKEYYNLIKELNNMSTRRNRKQRFLDESLEDLLEMNLFEEDDADEPEDDEDDMPMDDETDDDEELDLDIPMDDDDDMPSLDDMGGSVSADTTVEDLAKMAGLMGDSEPSDEDDDEEDLELEGFFESDMGEDTDEDMHEMSELEEMYEMDEITDEELDEADDLEEMYESRGNRRNKVLEIDENMLRREIGRMKAIREGEAKDMASHFGGGSLEGEVFVDGVELNKLHEMRNKAAKVVRKNRMLESKLAQYKKALRGMKGQLQEMNLFNAKLLYANKLMQNRDLSIKQQRHVVESLDEAKTLGEAKILFESLSKSLVSRPASKSRNLNESASRRTLNASSAPVRSAQTRRESVALDRWATLAGIKK